MIDEQFTIRDAGNYNPPPDYLGLLSDDDRKLFEDRMYYSYEPLMLALCRRLEKLAEKS